MWHLALSDIAARWPDRFARLHAEAQRLRARIAQVQREYEAGSLSLDEELALFRAIEREMAAIGVRMHDLASERPASMPGIPR